MIGYRYDKSEKSVYDNQEEDFGDICSFLDSQFSLSDNIKSELTDYTNVHHSTDRKQKLNSQVHDYLEKHFENFFLSNQKETGFVLEKDLEKEVSDVLKSFEKHSAEIEKLICDQIDSIFKHPKTGGDNMFKNLKEAKMFTAHLDALANEIQELDDVSPEMRRHLAYRLDRLSDLIETETFKKEANGIGHGAWAQDADEKYMETFGGTGALLKDKDDKSVDEFKGEDHMSVLMRKEPSAIHGDGAKVKQPSDSVDEKQIAEKLRSYVKKAMAKL